MITYDDFAKLDIRIGEVLEVEVVEGADKLLALTVDLGERGEEGAPHHRHIVSGIREHVVDPQTLVGKRYPFLANLESRTIRGHESAGMILAAGGKEGVPFALLAPTTELPPGTKVS